MRLPIKIKKQKFRLFEICWETQRPKYVLSQMPLGLVNVVGCGPTKPFKVSEGNHDARPPPLNSRQRSRC
jgi:hypothetical protein